MTCCHTLFDAARFGHIRCLKELIGSGDDPSETDESGGIPLFEAAAAGRLDCAAFLAPLCDVNRLDLRGRTALSWAVQNGWTEVCKLLLSCGADPSLSAGGTHCLHFAAMFGRNACAGLLAKASPRLLQTPDLGGLLPEQVAAAHNRPVLADALRQARLALDCLDEKEALGSCAMPKPAQRKPQGL